MHLRFLILLGLLCLLCPAPSLAAGADSVQQTLRIAVEKDYPPFAFIDESGELRGFDVDVARALCEKMQRDCRISTYPFSDILPALVEGDIDLAVAGMAETEKRREQALFSNAYYRGRSIFVELTGRNLDASPGGARGLTICVQAGSIQEQYLGQHYKEQAVILPLPDFDSVLSCLRQGRADLCLVDGLPAYALLRSSQGSDLELAGEPVAMEGEDGCIAVARPKPELLEAVNAALAQILADGTHERINFRYFSLRIY